jgi:hypothetical protein
MVTVMMVGMILGCGTGPERSEQFSVPELLLASIPEAGTPSDGGGSDGALDSRATDEPVDSAADVAADALFDALEAGETGLLVATNSPSLDASAVRAVVGGGTTNDDYVAYVTGGFITQAVGTFSFVTGAPTESGLILDGGGPYPNIYSIQMNSNALGSNHNQSLPYSSVVNTLCNPSGFPSPKCYGWQQAIYSTSPYGPPGPASLVFEYWLDEFNQNVGLCPAPFTHDGTNSNVLAQARMMVPGIVH